jgi:glycosyltransferase involved in cell wall biosynthesis
VGGESKGPCLGELWHDIKNVGLDGYRHFIGNQPNPLKYFAAFDVFALVSREDPFPLVCLEAASLGKPIVCFDNSGGEKEFVEDDCGFVVPDLDIETIASKVVKLLEAADLRQRLGKRAGQKVRERHDVEVIAPKILGIINTCLIAYLSRLSIL